MQIRFTKGLGKHDTMDVLRSGSVVETMACPKQGIIPHDMVHFAVETTLQKRGFVRRIVDGEVAAFRMAGEAESDGVERLVEVFQADGWSGWTSAVADMLDLYQVTCRARQCEPLGIHASDLEAVRKVILDLTAQWQAIPAGESLLLPFEQALS